MDVILSHQEIALYAAIAFFIVNLTKTPIQRSWSRIQLWRNGQVLTTCFYCNEECAVVSHAVLPGKCWRCIECDNVNYYDVTGKPKLVDEGLTLEAVTNGVLIPSASTKPSTRKKQQSITFCNKCIQNQNILIQLLAAYNPEDDEYFDSTVEAYKRHIEAQYPPVCSKCDPLVQNRLNDIARNIKATFHLGTQRIMNGLSASSRETVSYSILYAVIWGLMISGSILIHFLTLLAYLRGLLFPASYHPGYCHVGEFDSSKIISLFNLVTTLPTSPCDRCFSQSTLASLSMLSAFSFLAILFNPLWILKIRYPNLETKNQIAYVCLHIKLLAMRLFSFYILQYPWSVRMHAILEAGFLILTLIGLVMTYSTVQVKEKSGLKWNYNGVLQTANVSNIRSASGGMKRLDSGYAHGNVNPRNTNDLDDFPLGLELPLRTAGVQDDEQMLIFLRERNTFMKWKARAWTICAAAIGIRCVSMAGFDSLYFALVVILCIALEACRKGVSTCPIAAKGTSLGRILTSICILMTRLVLILPPLLFPNFYPALNLSTTRSLYPLIPSLKGTELLAAFDVSKSSWVSNAGVILDTCWITIAVLIGVEDDSAFD